MSFGRQEVPHVVRADAGRAPPIDDRDRVVVVVVDDGFRGDSPFIVGEGHAIGLIVDVPRDGVAATRIRDDGDDVVVQIVDRADRDIGG